MLNYHNTCELCTTPGGELIWQDGLCRVVRVSEPDYPGFCRVILNRHVKEMSDLQLADREKFMAIVIEVELAIREVLKPDKINLASLGNMTPHLHWHVIPRFVHDKHFPNPIWGQSRRETVPVVLEDGLANKLKRVIQTRLG